MLKHLTAFGVFAAILFVFIIPAHLPFVAEFAAGFGASVFVDHLFELY